MGKSAVLAGWLVVTACGRIGFDPLSAAPDAPSGPTLSLLAGKLGGSGYADGIGSEARFNDPQAIDHFVDISGDVYVGDSFNHVIRKLVVAPGPQFGAVTTLAGLAGANGSADGTGSAARFFVPSSVAYDGAGNLYVADTNNFTIRKVVVAPGPQLGEVSTVAGLARARGSVDDTGSAARFDYLGGLVYDGVGSVYVTCWTASTIRKVVVAPGPQFGTVTTVAGTAGAAGATDAIGAAARFNQPTDIVYDGAGNLFVADAGNHAIRKVDLTPGPTFGTVTTPFGQPGVAGSADGIGNAAAFNYPEGLTYGAGNLYVADSRNRTIRAVELATGQVTTVAGLTGFQGTEDGVGSLARFDIPIGMSFSPGFAYAVDLGGAIRQIVVAPGPSYGAVTTTAGLPAAYGAVDGAGTDARFYAPTAVAYDGADNLYVGDTYNYTIRKVAIADGAVTTVAGQAGLEGSSDGIGTAASFSSIRGVIYDGAGNLYVADTPNHTIRKIVVAPGPQLGEVTTLAGQPGMAGSTDGNGSAARFNNPRALAYDGASNLYVADTNNHTIRRIVVAGAQFGEVTTEAGTAGTAGSSDGFRNASLLQNPSGLATDGAGNLYIADSGNLTLRKMLISGGQYGLVNTVAGQIGAAGKLDGIGNAARFEDLGNLAYDSAAGILYLADGNMVRVFDVTTGEVSTLIGVPGQSKVALGPLPAGLNWTGGLAALPAGGLAITDASENVVLRLTR